MSYARMTPENGLVIFRQSLGREFVSLFRHGALESIIHSQTETQLQS
jgi:hypothetical protein